MTLLLLLAAASAWIGPAVPPDAASEAELRPATVAAFQGYVQQVEAGIDQRVSGRKNFLWLDDSPARRAGARRGEVVTDRVAGTRPVEVPDGLVHDFVGAVFIPGATIAQALSFVQDYDHHKDFYGPEVVDSRIVSRDGEHFVIDMRLRKHKVITVVLNTRHDALFFRLDQSRWHSRSRTTKVTEIENPGTREERELPAGGGHGFMWNLNSYWRFVERDAGVYVECQAVSLSRGIPWGFGWLIGPIVNELPRESLAGTLAATRTGVARLVDARR
jgi:hypothetical protein